MSYKKTHALFPHFFQREISVRNRNPHGFTLVEVLVALAVLSIVLAALYSTFHLSHKAVEGLDESMIKLQESRKALDILKRELDSSFYSLSDDNTFFKIQDRDIYGKQATQLTFTTFSPVKSGLCKISYYLEDKDGTLHLFKKIESHYEKENTEGFEIMEGLEAFLVEAQYGDQWVRTWDTGIQKTMPSKIRFNLTITVKEKSMTIFDSSTPMLNRSI